MEKIYAKIKEFARVTLSTRKESNDKEIVSKFTKNVFGPNNSENNSQASAAGPVIVDQLNITNDTVPGETPDHSYVTNDSDINSTNKDRKWLDESPNVMSFNEFSESPLATANIDKNDAAKVDNDKVDDIESLKIHKIVSLDGNAGDNEITENVARHGEARGRSLWHVSISERDRQGKVIESSLGNEVNDHHRGLEASFSSFTQDGSAVIFETDDAGGVGTGILEWSNIIIVTVSIAASFAFLTGNHYMSLQ